MKGMIFAAGLGSRLKPWTDHHPKALAVVNGKVCCNGILNISKNMVSGK
jgi:NDP-sugar pyrophosphorylase family protein